MTQPIKLDYRLDYSPKCVHCYYYDYETDSCDMGTDEDPNPTYPSCNYFKQRQDDYCEHCGKPYDDVKDEVITESDGCEEFWGARVPRPDVVVGFICDDCRNFNYLE